jgi:hypothetical protein
MHVVSSDSDDVGQSALMSALVVVVVRLLVAVSTGMAG